LHRVGKLRPQFVTAFATDAFHGCALDGVAQWRDPAALEESVKA
jgi:hypothetical protein